MSLLSRFRPGVFLAVIPVTIAIDQLSKMWVERNLSLAQITPFIPFVSFYRTYNDGIAFSMLSGLQEWGLVLIACIVLGFVTCLWQSTEAERSFARLGFAMVWGGAVGNLIDRIAWGHVIDFILVHTQTWSFAIFNLADSFITVGAALVILDEFLAWRRAKSEARG